MAAQDAPVLIITGDFVPTGGMDRANLALAEALAAHGRTLHLVAHRADESLLARPNVTLHKVPRPLGSHWLGSPLLNLYGQRVAHRLARSGPRPLVVVNGGNCRTPFATINWTHYVHAAWEPEANPGQGLARSLKTRLARRAFLSHEKTAFRQAPLIVANSHLTANQVHDMHQVPPDRIHVIHYGSDPATFGPVAAEERRQSRQMLGLQHDTPTILFVGALGDSRKGFDILFDAWRVLNGLRPGWSARLLVVGSGASVPKYQEAVEAAGLAGQITFLGFRRDVPQLLAAADLLVSPARYEAYGLNVHEALCRGCAVLVSAQAGVAQRLPAESPMRLPPDLGPELLAHALTHWLEHPSAYQNQAVEMGKMLQKETWDIQMQKLIQLADTLT